jgi:arabinofuranan 3-O-arabinosyltransferase
VLAWQADNRSLSVGSGAATYVEIHENFNAGWTANLNGRALTAVRLDGWQQAFIVPAGQGGVISLSYAPATLYHAGLIASALALAVLAALAIGLGGRRSGRRLVRRAWRLVARWSGGRVGPRGRRRLPTTDPSHAVSGPTASTWRSRAGRPMVRTVAVFIPLAVVIWLAGGPLVLAVPVLAGLGWWRPRWLPAVTLGSMLIAGVAAAAGDPTAMGSGAFGGLAQASALVALAAALTPAIPRTTVPTTEGLADDLDGPADGAPEFPGSTA